MISVACPEPVKGRLACPELVEGRIEDGGIREVTCRNIPKSEIRNPKSFWRDESGQGIIFAAASLLVLVGFVALVYNIGRLTARRTKIQTAADAAVYSGAMVEANALSTIGWINSAMAQLYYNACKYAVDVNITGVAAELEGRLGTVNGPARQAYDSAYSRAAQHLPRMRIWMADLSRIENAIAILTPRLLEEEMFAVAARSGAVADRPAVERLSIFPSYRMFPHGGRSVSYLVEQLSEPKKGWRVTNLSGGNNEMIEVFLEGNEWHLKYSLDGIVVQEVVIEEEEPRRWHIRYYQPPGNLIQEIFIVQTENLGWVIWGETQGSGGGMQEIPEIRFDPVDMDGDGYEEGTRITQGDVSQVFMRGPDGDLYVWDNLLKKYVNMTTSETVIGGVRVRINVSNVIHFPGGSAHIGTPTTVNIGRAHIVLSDPPTISTSLGPVHIAVHGFDPDSFSISVGGFSLTHGDADGRWRKHYNPHEEIWWRHRLTEQVPEQTDTQKQWQYDHQTIGAHLQYESNMVRFVLEHAFGDRFGPFGFPEWTAWFDPMTGTPRQLGWRHTYSGPDESGLYHPDQEPPADAYYLTSSGACPTCGGDGRYDPDGDGPIKEGECPACHARDHDGDGFSDIRVFIADIPNRNCLSAGIFSGPEAPRLPLVLAEEFFQYGMNVGTWRSPSSPMLFPEGREPDWGYVAISSARLRIADPLAPDAYRETFDTREEREDWCLNSPHNLYTADVQARLYPGRYQMNEYDLDRDILLGTAVRVTTESPTTYLWDAILATRYQYPYESNVWLDRYDGRSDPRIGERLRNMRDRKGRRFDFNRLELDDVIQH